jgi:glycosyltransferase involved in cell wall biosynthesis
LSGVTTWADQLRASLANHPRYEVKLLYVGTEEPEGFDLHVPTLESAHQLVRQLAPAILVPNYLWELFLTGFEPGVHCVGMCHADSDEQYYSPLSWYEPLISKFIAVSQECSKRLVEHLPFRAEDVTTLPYGISVPRRLSRNYQNDPLRLIYAGRVTQLQKRVWDYVPLVEHLWKANVRFVFDIIGEGDEFEPLQTEMQSRFPTDIVRFHPRIPHQQMPDVWSGHDIFVQVSEFEGTSISMLESMAYGVVPVVTAASSGIAGVIHPRKNGFVVPIGDMKAMAQAMTQLALDPSLLASTGQAAHQTAQAYSMDFYRERITRFFDEVVQAGKQIDLHKRYGMFGTVHPLFKQRQLIVHQQEQIARLQQGASQQSLDGVYQYLWPPRMRRFLSKRRA